MGKNNIPDFKESFTLLELGKEGTRNLNQICLLFVFMVDILVHVVDGCNVGTFIGRSEVNFAHLPQSLSSNSLTSILAIQ